MPAYGLCGACARAQCLRGHLHGSDRVALARAASDGAYIVSALCPRRRRCAPWPGAWPAQHRAIAGRARPVCAPRASAGRVTSRADRTAAARRDAAFVRHVSGSAGRAWVPAAMVRTSTLIARVEKYRPRYLKDVVGNAATIERLQAIEANGNCPHLLVSVRESRSR